MKNRDGSYKLWGYQKSDSVWLTAYVLKCLGHIRKLININDVHIYDAMNNLASKQNSLGDFADQGPLGNKRIQGGVTSNVALTAFIAVSFLENSLYRDTFQHVIDKALKFVDINAGSLRDMNTIAIASYAFALANHSSAQSFISDLKSKAIYSEDMMHWENDHSEKISESQMSLTLKIETAAYALLAILKTGDETTARLIMNWLVSKRNVDGGFYSTQDTVIGLQALAEIAKIHCSKNLDMKINIDLGGQSHVFEIKKSEGVKRQILEIPSKIKTVSLSATGTGKALVNFWNSYNLPQTITSEFFKVTANVIPDRDGGVFYLEVCVKLLEKGSLSKMVVMEISLPSGYIYDSPLEELMNEHNVKVS
jgi:CD109 antigen